MTARPLDGIAVIDTTQLLPGAFCSRRLADLGASVTRIVRPGADLDAMAELEAEMGGDGSLSAWLQAGKRSESIELRERQGRERFLELLAGADVWVESWLPAQAEVLRLGSAPVADHCPRLIRCTITACGVDGELAARGGHDLNVLAMTGVLSALAEDGQKPIVPGVQIAGVGAGALPAIQAILAALFARERGAGGEHVVISMLHELEPWLGLERSLARGRSAPRGAMPCYGVYVTRDGRFVALGAARKSVWRTFCEFAGRPEWVDRRFDAAIRPDVEEFIALRSYDEWLAVSNERRTGVEVVREVGAGLSRP